MTPVPSIPDGPGAIFLERFAVIKPLRFVFCSLITSRALVISPWSSTTAAPSLSPSIASIAVSYSAGASNISETWHFIFMFSITALLWLCSSSFSDSSFEVIPASPSLSL